MKITKRQLRRIIKEERARLLAEQPRRPMPKGVAIERDALIVADKLEGAFFDALEELGADAQAAADIEYFLKSTAVLDTSFANALENYNKKLDMMGGNPKPRNV